MSLYLYKLKFKGSVHFGDTGIDLENIKESINSDTLFSALVNCVSIHYGSKEAEELIRKFLESPPFLLSSLFVYKGNSYFLPKPLDDSFIPIDVKKSRGKELKKIKWLEREDFLKWVKGASLNEEDIDALLSKQTEYNQAFIKEIRPRVVLDRTTQQSSIYHCGYLYFSGDAGLYGIVKFNDIDFIPKFKSYFSLLGETGIGGEKTYGCGMFEVDFKSANEIFPDILKTNGKNYILLSLYHPSESERESLKDNLISYNLMRKKGWIVSGRQSLPLKRKSVGFVIEGSVSKTNLKGCLVEVTPENLPNDLLSHKVYRYGYAFTIPLI